jgi:hypothetical protein
MRQNFLLCMRVKPFRREETREQAVHRAQLDQGEVGATQEGGRARGTGFSRGHGVKRSSD